MTNRKLNFYIYIFMFPFVCGTVFADDANIGHEIVTKYQIIEELKKEIAQIDSEQIRCEKMKNGWIVATVVGGVGVIATGTAAIIQGTKLKDKPKTKKTQKTETNPETETSEQ